MYVSNLMFFKEKIKIDSRNREDNLNIMAANLKSEAFKNIFFIFIQQELALEIAKKKRRLQLKFTARKRKAKKRLILRASHKIELIGRKQSVALNLPNVMIQDELNFEWAKYRAGNDRASESFL